MSELVSGRPPERLDFMLKSIRPVQLARCSAFRANKVLNCSLFATMHTVPKLKDSSLLKNKGYINGEWVDAKDSKTFNVDDPATMKTICTCPEMSQVETKEAIKYAQEAFETFRFTLPRQRGRMLRKLSDLVHKNLDDLATIITWENGKPFAEAKGEVAYAASFYEWFGEEASRIYGTVIPASVAGNRVITMRQPVGVCGIITPWNFPAAMISRKLGAAIAAGCSVVIKPGGETPLTALAIAELCSQAGLPKGVVNVVTGLANTKEIGLELTKNPVVKKVSFTGSTAVGKLLMEQSASTLKKVSFELGGNAPLIVFDDADIDAAVAGAIACKFRSSGQTCVCANRIFVHAGIYEQFCKKFTEKVKGFKLGGGFEESTTHGPLIHGKAVEKIEKEIKDATSSGAKIVIGGNKSNQGSNFFEPTVLTEVTNEMVFTEEETFGPIAPIYRFNSEEEVLSLCNSVNVGLAGYFFSKDVQRVWRVAEKLEVGMVGVNTGILSDAAAPFGGIKESGFGREGSLHGIDEYTIVKSVTFGGI